MRGSVPPRHWRGPTDRPRPTTGSRSLGLLAPPRQHHLAVSLGPQWSAACISPKRAYVGISTSLHGGPSVFSEFRIGLGGAVLAPYSCSPSCQSSCQTAVGHDTSRQQPQIWGRFELKPPSMVLAQGVEP